MVLAIQDRAITGAVAQRVLRHRKPGSRRAIRGQVRLTRLHIVLDNVLLLLEKLMQNLGSGDPASLKWGIRRKCKSKSGMATKSFELPGAAVDSRPVRLANSTGGVWRQQRACRPRVSP